MGWSRLGAKFKWCRSLTQTLFFVPAARLRLLYTQRVFSTAKFRSEVISFLATLMHLGDKRDVVVAAVVITRGECGPNRQLGQTFISHVWNIRIYTA